MSSVVPIGPRLAWGFMALAATLAASGVTMPPAVAVPVLAVTFAWTAGWRVAVGLLPRQSVGERALFALVASPFLTGAVLVGLALTGVPFATAARLVAVAVALLAAHATITATPERTGAGTPLDRGVMAFAMLWGGVVAAFMAANPWLPPRSDGAFHGAVVLQIAARGIPPEDPYFAGVPLLYFWATHAWAAAWLVLAPALAVWTPLITLNISGAVAVALAVGAIARRLGASPGAARVAVLLALAGYTPLGFHRVLAQSFTGDVRGLREFGQLLDAGVDTVLQTLGRGELHASLAFFGDKYLVLTPFGLGLAAFGLVVALVLEVRRDATVRSAVALAIALAAALFVHSVAGLVAFGAAGVVWSRACVTASRDAAARRALVPLACAALAAAAVVAPYFAAIALGKQGQLALGLTSRAWVSWGYGGALLVPAGGVALVRRMRREAAAADVAWIAGAVTLLALCVRLPENNQSKFLNLLFLLLAAPAALGAGDLAARLAPPWRPGFAVALAGLLAPGALFALLGFALERGSGPQSWKRLGTSEAAAMAWVRRNTAANAVFADLGGARDLNAVAGRSVLWGGPVGERDWGASRGALEARRDAVRSLCRGEAPADSVVEMLQAMRRPVYVVARAEAAADSASAWNRLPRSGPSFRRAWGNDALAFWTWDPAR